MPKLLLLLSCWFIASGSICQSSPAGFPDTSTITELSVGKAQIGMSVGRVKALYKSCTFKRQSMKAYGWLDNGNSPSGLCISFKGKPLFVADISEGRIWAFIVLDTRYKTSKGIHVGTTAANLKRALPAAVVHCDAKRPNVQIAQSPSEEEGEEAITYCFSKAAKLGLYDSTTDTYFTQSVPLLPLSAPVNWITVIDTSLDI